jgi:hypothetical protein
MSNIWVPRYTSSYSSASQGVLHRPRTLCLAGSLSGIKAWAPLKCKHLPTADWREHHGLQHGSICLLCSQGQESVEHLAFGCVFFRVIWSRAFHDCLLPQSPTTAAANNSLLDWWSRARASIHFFKSTLKAYHIFIEGRVLSTRTLPLAANNERNTTPHWLVRRPPLQTQQTQ